MRFIKNSSVSLLNILKMKICLDLNLKFNKFERKVKNNKVFNEIFHLIMLHYCNFIF